MSNLMAWSGRCRDCNAIFVVAADEETSNPDQLADGPNEWDAFSSCFVCDGSVDWNGNDPVEHVLVHH